MIGGRERRQAVAAMSLEELGKVLGLPRGVRLVAVAGDYVGGDGVALTLEGPGLPVAAVRSGRVALRPRPPGVAGPSGAG